MNEQRPQTGDISWADLTIPDADAVRDFYAQVIGWTWDEVPMGDYADYAMCRGGDGQAVAGICHARGANAGLPPQWLVYISVDDVDRVAEQCERAGGSIVAAPRSMGQHRFGVLRDPAGAVFAIVSAK